jgi:hypothetical protein
MYSTAEATSPDIGPSGSFKSLIAMFDLVVARGHSIKVGGR